MAFWICGVHWMIQFILLNFNALYILLVFLKWPDNISCQIHIISVEIHVIWIVLWWPCLLNIRCAEPLGQSFTELLFAHFMNMVGLVILIHFLIDDSIFWYLFHWHWFLLIWWFAVFVFHRCIIPQMNHWHRHPLLNSQLNGLFWRWWWLISVGGIVSHLFNALDAWCDWI